MVLKLNFKGLMAPVFTPFSRKTGKVDVTIITKYAQHLIQNGIQGVLVNGTVGEGVCMSVQERKQVLEAWLETTRNTSLHVMVQIGGPAIVDVQDLARHAEEKGVNSLLCLPELFHRPQNVEELVHYLTLVSKAAPKTPLLYYHFPASTGVTFDMEHLLKAGRHEIPTLAGVKFTHNNLEEGGRCLRFGDGQFAILLGNDYLISAGFFEGFDSLIATMLNMFGILISNIQKHINDNEISQARTKQLQLIKAIETITKYGKWVPAMKEAMYIITGLDLGTAREPQGVLNEAQVTQLRSDLIALGVAKS